MVDMVNLLVQLIQKLGVVPISLSFVKEDKDWKIYSIKKPSSGIQEETHSAQMPSEKKQIKLVSDSMHVFALSIKEKSMLKMFNHVSNLWKKQFSVEKFDETFGSFYKFGDSLMLLDQRSPQFFSKPILNKDGVLIIEGFYSTKPKQLYFEQKYIYEGLSWKLMGFNISVK